MKIPNVCVACEGGIPPLTTDEAQEMLGEISGWEMRVDGKMITKKYVFQNFAGSLAFVNKVGEVAEAEGHHPDIHFGWGYVEVTLTTHAVGGLSFNDFVVAKKIDAETHV